LSRRTRIRGRCGLAFVASSPLARGLLTEWYLEPGRAGSGDRLVDEGALAKLATPQIMANAEGCARASGGLRRAVARPAPPLRSARPAPPLVRALADLAHGQGLPLSQLALAYMLGLPGVVDVDLLGFTLRLLLSAPVRVPPYQLFLHPPKGQGCVPRGTPAG